VGRVWIISTKIRYREGLPILTYPNLMNLQHGDDGDPARTTCISSSWFVANVNFSLRRVMLISFTSSSWLLFNSSHVKSSQLCHWRLHRASGYAIASMLQYSNISTCSSIEMTGFNKSSSAWPFIFLESFLVVCFLCPLLLSY
jgi:hypothetical protein